MKMPTEKKSVTRKPSRPVTEKKPAKPVERKPRPPAFNPEAREKQLVSLAIGLAEKQLIDGTASPSVINHFLKLAGKRETLEQEILAKQSELIQAKAQSINKDKDAQKLAKAAIDAMQSYRPEA